MIRALLALAAWAFCTFASAASVQDRSPFAQGLWWDPQKPGSGFELFDAGGTVMVVWYTYEADGRPVWYTAEGPVTGLGNEWPLARFHWNGSRAEPTTVGTLRLTPATSESAQIAWKLGGTTGTIAIAPFIQSGMVNEVDDSGTWFDAGHPGWGLTMLDQGDVIGAAFFLYDPAGEPTWVAGFERNTLRFGLWKSTGACPGCPYRQPTTVGAGSLAFDWVGDAQITLHPNLSIPIASGIRIDGARLQQLSRPASSRRADRELARYDASSLKRYLAQGMTNVPLFYASSGTDISAAPPGGAGGTAFSPTNLQEAGVDEAGLVKSDGTRVFSYDYGAYGVRLPAIRVARVDADGASASLLGTVALGGGQAIVRTAGLMVYADKLVSIHGSQTYSSASYPYASGSNWTNGRTQVEVFDIAGALPSSRWKLDLDGYIIATRRIGATLYVVSRFTPTLPGFVFSAYDTATRQANQARVEAASLEQLLPSLRLNGNASAPLVSADKVYAPPQGTRLAMADLVTVTAIDLDNLRIADTLSIAGSVETVYASASSIVFASSRWDSHAPTTGTYLPEPPFARTDLHLVRLGAAGLSIVGSASVEGSISALADQAPFRISEFQGKVRVVTTSSTALWGDNANRLTVLEPSTTVPGLLKTIAWLPNAARPDRLGKPRETLHATRFAGDRLYAVTFKKIDPLYVVDLSRPADPFISGALQMPGFSEYLHPLPNGLMLGFGKDAIPVNVGGDFGEFAWYQGLQVALYDVGTTGQPAELQRVLIGRRGSNSALLEHHHAFSELQVAPGRLAFAIPASVNDGTPSYPSGDSTYYPWQYTALLRFELQGTTAADAKIVPMGSLTISDRNKASTQPSPDPGASGGRSVLFLNGTVFSGYGRFWHLDPQGAVSGPF